MSYIEIEENSRKIFSWILFVRTFVKEMVLDITPNRQKKTIVIRYTSLDEPLIALKYTDRASEYKNPKYTVVSLTLLHNPALLRRMLALAIKSTTKVLCEAPEYIYPKWAKIMGGAQHADDSG